jgi:hypothetical protein
MLRATMAVRPLDPDDSLAHFVRPADDGPIPGAPQPYEWWYFEFHFPGPALDADGNPIPEGGAGADDWVVVISCHLPHFYDPVRLMDVTLGGNSRGTGQQLRPTFDHAGLAISIYRCTPTEPLIHSLVGFSATRTVESMASTTAPFRARWGRPNQAKVTIEEKADGAYEIVVADLGWWAARGLVDRTFQGKRARPLEIDMKLTFRERSPGFKINDGVLVSDRWGGKHHWVLRMPDAHVTGRVTLTAEGLPRPVLDLPVDTIGYHDHQWGPHLPMDVMREWSWGRVLVSPDERPEDQDLMVFFRSEPLLDEAHPADPGVEVQGADIFAYVPSGQQAALLEPPAGQPSVLPGGWDAVNYPLRAYDPVDVAWSEGRSAHDVRAWLEHRKPREDDSTRPQSGPPFWIPDDDTKTSLVRWLGMLVGRPIARKRLRGEIGYWGAISCQGRGATGPGGQVQDHRLLVTQRGASIEPWPFYNRYIPRAAASRGPDGVRRDRIQFALSEYLEVNELLSQKPPFMHCGKPVYMDLFGMAFFSEFMTTVEPGAPKLKEMLRHFW